MDMYSLSNNNQTSCVAQKILNAEAIIAIIGDDKSQIIPVDNRDRFTSDSDQQLLSLLALKNIVQLKGIDDYFIVTTNTSGLVRHEQMEFDEENIWEMYGSNDSYQNQNGRIFNNKDSKHEFITCSQKGLRPNVFTPNDSQFNTQKSDQKAMNFKEKVNNLRANKKKVVILEYNTVNNPFLNQLGGNLYKKSNNSTLIRVGDKGIHYYDKKDGIKFLPAKNMKSQEAFSYFTLNTLQLCNNETRSSNQQKAHLALKELCYKQYVQGKPLNLIHCSNHQENTVIKLVSNTQVVQEEKVEAPPPVDEKEEVQKVEEEVNFIEVAGCYIADRKSQFGYDFVLNGAGIRSKYWMSIYVGALFLTEKTSDPEKILNDDEPQLIELTMVSPLITVAKFNAQVDDSFQKATGGKSEACFQRLQYYKYAFRDEKMVPGDIQLLFYKPGVGLACYLNDKLVCTIEGLDFKKAYFSIWFGDKSAVGDLKQKMLGK